MSSAALRELQIAALPAAIGSFAIVYSNIVNMKSMGTIRYADKSKEVHPYKPWTDDSASAEPHFRAFKACQNGTEWTVYCLPALWIYVMYTPSIPVVGTYLSWAGLVLALGFAYYNVEYVKAYTVSAQARIAPFSKRTMFFRFIAYGAMAGMASCTASAMGLF